MAELGSDKAGLGDYLCKVGLRKYTSILRIIDNGRQVSHCQRGELEYENGKFRMNVMLMDWNWRYWCQLVVLKIQRCRSE